MTGRNIDTASATTSTMSTGGTDDPDQLIGVAAGELFEWAWLIADLADWLGHTDAATRFDFVEFFNGYRNAAATAFTASHIAERIAALLDGDRGQP